MTSIIIAGRPNSEETSECIIVAENIANLYPSSRFTIVLKSPNEWENYCEDICNLFGILKKTHPLIMFSNGTQIGGQQQFFKLISESFKYDKLIKREDEYFLDIDQMLITNLTKENSLLVEKEYTCRTKGSYTIDKISKALDKIPIEHYDTIYYKYNTIESDYQKKNIDDMKVFVKYNEKFTPQDNDYKEEIDVVEMRTSYVEKEIYDNYHEELERKREEEEERKRKEEEIAKLKAEGLYVEEEEKNDEEEKKEGEEENKEGEEGNKEEENKEEENKEEGNKEGEEGNKEGEEEKKEGEEEKKEGEEEKKEGEEEKEVEIDPETGLPIEPVIPPKEYKEIHFYCYPDFDIPIEFFDKELLVENYPNDNFQLLINPYFTFYGETIINIIKDPEGPKLIPKEKPIIIPKVEENLEEIEIDEKVDIKDNKKDNKKDDKKDNKKDDKKDKKDDKKDDKKNKKEEEKNEEEKEEVKEEEPIEPPPKRIHNPELPTTYEPNLPEDKMKKNKLLIKDFGKLPSLRIMHFTDDDLQFYQDEIPPYQLENYITNTSNLYNLPIEHNILFDDQYLKILINMVNETKGYLTYKILPYKYSDWKCFNTGKIKIIPNKPKDLKQENFPLVDKINQKIQKIKRQIFNEAKKKFIKNKKEKPNFESILNNPFFDQCFELPEYLTIDVYDSKKIKHLIKTFTKDTLNMTNLRNSIKEMMNKFEINNITGNGLILILNTNFLFMAPLTEPFAFIKGKNENPETGEFDTVQVPIFAEPYFFLGVFTLPLIESEWPESIKRKYVEFNLEDILINSTN